MAQRIPLLRLSHVFRMAEYLRCIGYDPGALLDQCRIPKCQEETSGSYVSAYAAGDFLKRVTHRTGLSSCMLQAGLQEGLSGCYSPEAQLAHTCVTLKELVHILIGRTPKESSLAHVVIRFNKTRNGDVDPLFISSDTAFSGIAQAEQYRVGVSIYSVRMFVGWKWCPERIYLQENYFDKDLIKESFADSKIYFNSNFTAFSVPYELLHSTPRRTEMNQTKYHEDCPGNDCISSLRQLMRTYLTRKNFTIDVAAEHSLLSVRTMQRVLSQHMTSYSRLLYQTRFEVGRELLEQSDLPITEIASRVGYADPSRFTHAFRYWTGMSPSEYRKAFRVASDPQESGRIANPIRVCDGIQTTFRHVV